MVLALQAAWSADALAADSSAQAFEFEGSSQLAAISTKEQYLGIAAAKINPQQAEIYRYLNFDQLDGFEDQGRVVSSEEEEKVLAGV